MTFLYTTCWTLYIVIGHGKYGQTIGKRLLGIKVLDIQEQCVVGFKRAFYREAVWFFAEIVGLVYFMFIYNTIKPDKNVSDTYFDGYVRLTISIWFILELVTMFFNKKRRALHDHIAVSVVVDLNEMKIEDLQKCHENLLTSIQSK